MGYLYVLLALLTGQTKGYCGKKTSSYISTLPSTMLFNTVRMLICIPIGILVVALSCGTLSALKVGGTDILIAAVSGIATAVFVVSWILVVRSGAYMMVDVFLTLGIIVPVIACAVFFNEAVRVNQIVGILMLVVAAYIMCSYSMSIKGKITPKTITLLTISGLANGITQFSQKWFVYNASGVDTSVFNLYSYVFSSLTLIVCFLIANRVDKTGADEVYKNAKRLAIYVVIMALCIFLNSLFSTLAAKTLTATQLYPLMNGGSLTAATLMAAIFFKEKVTVRCVVGIGIAFAALLVINLL